MSAFRQSWQKCVTSAAVLLALASSAAAVEMEWVTVGSPGNLPDANTVGAVPTTYQIARKEVTFSQYAEFLNAKARPDTVGLYNGRMGGEAPPGGWTHSGIERTGSPIGTVYAVRPGYENKPVVWVNWYAAIRFANWMHNGQGSGDTESGAYTLLGGTPVPSNADAIVRNPGARVFLPSESEWYKAAYYDPAKPGGPGYWTYPTRTDAIPYSDQPPGTGAPTPSNTANFFKNDNMPNGYDDGYAVTGTPAQPTGAPGENFLTDVGAYTLSQSPFGTFDQGGNVAEWNDERFVTGLGVARGLRGGSFATQDLSKGGLRFEAPGGDLSSIGFRVAAVPEPAAAPLLLLGGAGLLWRRRERLG